MLSSQAPATWRAAALALCLATSACAAPEPDDDPAPEFELDLALTVDNLDVRHGSLRIEATMLDGSADVSMWLGPACEAQEVGRGIATRAGFSWSLSVDDLGRAIRCGLVVRAHGMTDEGSRVVKTASLDVSVSLVADGAEAARLHTQETTGEETTLAFATPGRATRLHVGGSVIGAEPEEEETMTAEGLFVSTFAVSNADLARSVLHRRHVSVLGEHFLATVAVGPLTLDVAEPVVESVPAPPAEEPAAEEGDSYSYGDG
ncbi:hypothetical protein BH11MYX4_BH11MYX4_39130 [soil metagenome]